VASGSTNELYEGRKPPMSIEGRVAVVTGATSGIGAEVARQLAAAGGRVVVAGRNEERGRAVVDEIVADGGEAAFARHELGDASSAGALVTVAEERFGPVDVLVNNGARWEYGPFAEVTPEAFREVFASNVLGTLELTRAVLPGMARRGHGRVLFVSSVLAHAGMAGTALYAASKAALEGMMFALLAEYARFGVTFNAVAPGLTETPMSEEMLSDPETRDQMVSMHPNGRLAVPSDVARVMLYFADDGADHAQGNVFVMDGGLTKFWT